MFVILATWELEIWRIAVQCQSRQKVSETSSEPIKAERGGMSVIPAMWEACIGEIAVQGETLPQKYNESKKG
jgi:hypothetical protein